MKSTKKGIIAFSLALILMFALVACSNESNNNSDGNSNAPPTSETPNQSQTGNTDSPSTLSGGDNNTPASTQPQETPDITPAVTNAPANPTTSRNVIDMWMDDGTAYMLTDDGVVRRTRGNVFVEIMTDVAVFHGNIAVKNDGTFWSITSQMQLYQEISGQIANIHRENMVSVIHLTDGTVWGNFPSVLKQLNITDVKTIYMTPWGNRDAVAYFIKTDGSLWRLYLDAGTLSTTPHETEHIMDDIADVSANGDVILKTDGTLWFPTNRIPPYSYTQGMTDIATLYGSSAVNTNGALIDFNSVEILPDVASVVSNTLIIQTDGTLWEMERGSPVQRLIDIEVTYVTASGKIYALQNDGILWTWYYWNSEPEQFLTDVATVFPGKHGYSFAVKKDGTLWAWGINYGGQLGDGTRESRDTPVLIIIP